MSKKSSGATAPTRRIALTPLSRVLPAARNVKTHDMESIKGSIKRFGFADALVLDERTGRLVSGHGRLEALSELEKEGAEPPDGVEVAGGEWCVPVQRGWASKNDTEAEAFLLAANKLVDAGGWDDAALIEVLKSLEEQDAAEGLGWDANELEALLAPPVVVEGATDAAEEWKGMPEFDQPDATAYRSLIVHFANQQAVEAFAALVKQAIGPRVKSIWYPKLEINRYSDKAYVAAAEGTDE